MSATKAALVVRLEPAGIALELAAGERLLDALDEHGALGIPTACRAGNCGACLLTVSAGAAMLTEPSARERQTLRALAAAADQRLGCQLGARAALGQSLETVVLVLRAPPAPPPRKSAP
jgi:ferredoxin